MYVHVRTTACRRWSGRSVGAQKNVESVSVSSFQIVAFEGDGWRRRCRRPFGRPFRPSRKYRSVARSPISELFRTNGGKFVSFLPDEEAGPARPSSKTWCGVHVKETPLQPRSSVQQTWGETRGFFWIFETRICGPKMCYTIDPATSSTRRHPTLKRLVEKELDEEAAEVSENARKKAFASLCAFITESILHTENVTDISQLCIKYVKFLNDEGVEKVRLEKGLMAISDILLGGCLEAFIPENFLWDFTDRRRREL